MIALLATLPFAAWPAAVAWLALSFGAAAGVELTARLGQLRAGTGLALVGLRWGWVVMVRAVAL